MYQELRNKAVDIIERCKDMSVATLREDGFPQATTVSFASDGLTLFFCCGADSQKARNLARDGRVSVTMTEPYDSWSDIRGVSMGAMAEELVAAAEIEEVAGLLLERFTQLQELEPMAPGTVKFFRVTPIVLSVLDYTKAFGHTETVSVSDNDIAGSLESMAHHWVAPRGESLANDS